MTSQSDASSPARRAAPRRALLALLVLTVAAGAGLRAGGAGTPQNGSGAAPGPLGFAAAGAGPVQISGRLDRGSLLAGGDGELKLELVLRTDAPAGAPTRLPTDVMVVLDRSGSLRGEPLQHARAAVRALLGELAPGDRLGLVSYASEARVDLPLHAAREGGAERFRAVLARLHAGGGTNLSAGLDRALASLGARREAGRAARVLLLSDGKANEGDASLEGLRARAARAVPGGFVLSTVGVGLDFDERLMTALADAGTGTFTYVRRGDDLAGVFAGEFEAARETVARGAALVLQPADGVEVVDVAGYPLHREAGAVVARPGDLFAGQERRLWVTLRAAAQRPAEALALGSVSLRWRDARGEPQRLGAVVLPPIAVVASRDDYWAGVDVDAFGEQLAADAVGRLKQGVADAVSRGRAATALQQIRRFEREHRDYLDRAGRTAEEEPAYREARQLRERVEEVLRPSASAEAPRALSKELTQEAFDGRRSGARRGAAGGR